MFTYHYLVNAKVKKSKNVVIFGAGKAGLKLEHEFRDTSYKVRCFIDDATSLQKRSIDGIKILSESKFKTFRLNKSKYDLLVIAMPSADKQRVSELYSSLNNDFNEIKILPSLNDILQEKILRHS